MFARLQIRSLILGFVFGCLIPLALILVFLFLGSNTRPVFREQTLGSGKVAMITSFHLLWGVEHDERNPENDCFGLEYALSAPIIDQQSVDQATLEVFELIRPISELWGFRKASVSAFPTVERKGSYSIYNFTRAEDGNWKFDRRYAKVFANE